MSIFIYMYIKCTLVSKFPDKNCPLYIYFNLFQDEHALKRDVIKSIYNRRIFFVFTVISLVGYLIRKSGKTSGHTFYNEPLFS